MTARPVYIMIAIGSLKYFDGQGKTLCRNAFAQHPTEEDKARFLAACKQEVEDDQGRPSFCQLDPSRDIAIKVLTLELVE